MDSSRVVHHIAAQATTIRQCLETHLRQTPEQASQLLSIGAIYLNKNRVSADQAVPAGAYLRVHLQPKRFPVEKVDWAKVILAEEKDFLLINKPAGIPTHASLDNLNENVLGQLRKVTGMPLLVTQRLDVPVGGLMTVAKTPEFQRRYNKWLGERKVHKRYRALVDTAAPTGLHVHWMESSDRCPKKISPEEAPGWLRCELTVLDCQPTALPGRPSWDVSLILHTGRTHQIRAQLAALRSHILGDRMYGARQSYRTRVPGEEGIGLFSEWLSFPGTENGMWEFKIAPPWARTVPKNGSFHQSVRTP